MAIVTKFAIIAWAELGLDGHPTVVPFVDDERRPEKALFAVPGVYLLGEDETPSKWCLRTLAFTRMVSRVRDSVAESLLQVAEGCVTRLADIEQALFPCGADLVPRSPFLPAMAHSVTLSLADVVRVVDCNVLNVKLADGVAAAPRPTEPTVAGPSGIIGYGFQEAVRLEDLVPVERSWVAFSESDLRSCGVLWVKTTFGEGGLKQRLEAFSRPRSMTVCGPVVPFNARSLPPVYVITGAQVRELGPLTATVQLTCRSFLGKDLEVASSPLCSMEGGSVYFWDAAQLIMPGLRQCGVGGTSTESVGALVTACSFICNLGGSFNRTEGRRKVPRVDIKDGVARLRSELVRKRDPLMVDGVAFADWAFEESVTSRLVKRPRGEWMTAADLEFVNKIFKSRHWCDFASEGCCLSRYQQCEDQFVVAERPPCTLVQGQKVDGLWFLHPVAELSRTGLKPHQYMNREAAALETLAFPNKVLFQLRKTGDPSFKPSQSFAIGFDTGTADQLWKPAWWLYPDLALVVQWGNDRFPDRLDRRFDEARDLFRSFDLWTIRVQNGASMIRMILVSNIDVAQSHLSNPVKQFVLGLADLLFRKKASMDALVGSGLQVALPPPVCIMSVPKEIKLFTLGDSGEAIPPQVVYHPRVKDIPLDGHWLPGNTWLVPPELTLYAPPWFDPALCGSSDLRLPLPMAWGCLCLSISHVYSHYGVVAIMM